MPLLKCTRQAIRDFVELEGAKHQDKGQLREIWSCKEETPVGWTPQRGHHFRGIIQAQLYRGASGGLQEFSSPHANARMGDEAPQDHP